MANRIYRRGVSYQNLTTKQLNSLSGNDFHMSEFHGINDDENFVNADQVSFTDANNLYVDDDGQLRQRPVIKSVNENVVDTVVVDGIIFRWKASDYSKRLYVEYNGKEYDTTLVLSTPTKAYITSWENMFVVFTGTSINGIIITDTGVELKDANSLLYIPETTVGDKETSAEAEKNNIFSTGRRTTFVFSEGTEIDDSGIVGKTVVIPIDGGISIVWEKRYQKVLVELIEGPDYFHELQVGSSAGGKTYLGIKYEDPKSRDRQATIYISKDGIIYDEIRPPLGSFAYVVNGKTYYHRVKYQLSDDGSTIFCFSTKPNTASDTIPVFISKFSLTMWKANTTDRTWTGLGSIGDSIPVSNHVTGGLTSAYRGGAWCIDQIANYLSFVSYYPLVQEWSVAGSSSVEGDVLGSGKEVLVPQDMRNNVVANAPSSNFAACIFPINVYAYGKCATIPEPYKYENVQWNDDIIAQTDIRGHLLIVFNGNKAEYFFNVFGDFYYGIDSISCINRQVIVTSSGNSYSMSPENCGQMCRLSSYKGNDLARYEYNEYNKDQWPSIHWFSSFALGQIRAYYITKSKSNERFIGLQRQSLDGTQANIISGTVSGRSNEAHYDPTWNNSSYTQSSYEQVLQRSRNQNSLSPDYSEPPSLVTAVSDSTKPLTTRPTDVVALSENFVATKEGLYDVSGQVLIPWLHKGANVIWLDDNGEFDYLSNVWTDEGEYDYLSEHKHYTSTLTKSISISVTFDGTDVPQNVTAIENFITQTLAIGNKLYQSQLTDDNKIYVPEDSMVELPTKITGLIKLTDSLLGVFTETATYLYEYNASYSESLSVNSFTLQKAKLGFGLKADSSLVYSIDGQYILLTTPKGLTALTYQQFIYTTEQTYSYLSENIADYYRKWCNDYNLPVKITNYRNWIILWLENNQVIWLLDTRNSSWWKWTLPYSVKSLVSHDNRLKVLCNTTEYEFEFRDFDSYLDNGTIPVSWSMTSQKIHFGAPTYYKHVNNLTLIVNREHTTDEEILAYDLRFYNYRNAIDTSDKETEVFAANSLKTQLMKFSFVKTNAFQFKIERSTEIDSNVQFAISDIVIKYRITEAIR